MEIHDEITSVCRIHPTEDALEEYAFGRLTEDQAAPLEEHLLICVSCQTALQDLDDYIRLVKAAAVSRPLEARAPFFTLPRLEWATAVALILVLAIFVSRPNPSAEPFALSLASYRGGENVSLAHAPAGRPLDLSINAVDLPAAADYRMEVVTAAGKVVWTSGVKPAAGRLSARIPRRLTGGLYWVRVYGPGSDLLSEFGLRLD